MVDFKQIETRVSALSEPVIRDLGLELIKVQLRRERRGLVLRVFIDREEGVGIQDCQNVSEELGMILWGEGVEEEIPGPYNLEVSSPGLDRPLLKEADFLRCLGQEVKVLVKEPNGERARFQGWLKSFQDGKATISRNGSDQVISREEIESIHVIFDWRAELKSRSQKGKSQKQMK